MYSTIQTAMLSGIRTIPVTVEVDIRNGMPVFDMVGFLCPEVREAKERVRTALHNCGIALPAKRITVNLSPGNIRKSGTGFDLPIAIALLLSMGLVNQSMCEGRFFTGELGLNGQLLAVNGVLPMVSDAKEAGCRSFVLPKKNRREAMLVNGVEVMAFSGLRGVIDFLNGKRDIQKSEEPISKAEAPDKNPDYSEVSGQRFLKRACEVAASGMHNMLLIGPPGAGKSMVCERMATILPPMTEEEKLEVSKIYSVCGFLHQKDSLMQSRPFRNPHHTVSNVGLSGGGSILHPGEISLAHNGVLFLDELSEFRKDALEILRQPMEEHQIHIVRSGADVTYPADFLLLAAMNPCSCGHYPDMQKCRCTPGNLRRYFNRISQPLIDRIDLCVEASPLSYEDLTGNQKEETSAEIRNRVIRCHQIQSQRYQKEDFLHNSRIPAAKLPQYCPLGEKQKRYMEHMYEKMSLTARTYHKILRVARTIADLEGSDAIQMKHLNEAICYRSINEKYWGGFQ